jgi:uncharacterized protein
MFLLSNDYIEIKNTPDRGRGIFAKKVIEPGTLIGDYLGKIIDRKAAVASDTLDHHYHMHLIAGFYVIGDKNEDGIHILNHSCTPNCGSDDLEGHAIYYAVRKILPGEELTIDYLLGQPDDTCNPCHHGCHCGSRLCRGTWHSADDHAPAPQSKNYKKELKDIGGQFGKKLKPLAAYPKAFPDDEFFGMFGSEHVAPQKYNDETLPKTSILRERIRESGKMLLFTKLHIKVFGVIEENAIIEVVS